MATRRAAAAAAAAASATATAQASVPPSTTANPHRATLLKQLVASFAQDSPKSALFYGERLFALEPQQESTVYLYSSLLVQNDHQLEAIHLLRQPIWFTPVLQSTSGGQDSSNPFAASVPHHHHQHHHRYTATTRLSRPAIECSLRCARLYAQCCLQQGREQEGRLVLSKIMTANLPLCTQPPIDLAASAHASSSSTLFASTSSSTTAQLELELARLAHAAQEHDRAIQAYRRVLDLNPCCWEAIEGLCAEGAPPDPDQLYPPRPRPAPPPLPTPTLGQQLPTAALSPLPNRMQYPPPLGPSQTRTTSAVPAGDNSWSFSNGVGAAVGKGGFFTPSDTASPILGAGVGIGGGKGKEKANGGGGGGGLFGAGGGGHGGASIWRRTVARPDVTEMSIDDSSSSSFDTSFFPPTLSYGTSLPVSQPPTTTTSSSSLFTPPAALSSAPIPGMKRTRGGAVASQQQQQLGSSNPAVTPDDQQQPALAPGRRVVRGVPGDTSAKNRGAGGAPPPTGTRRSSRLSRDTGSSTGASSTSMGLSRSQQTNASTISSSSTTTTTAAAARPSSAAAGGKKRTKASGAAGPPVLSDATGSPSGVSHSSSPAPSSPGATLGFNGPTSLTLPLPDPQLQEAEDYIVHLLRCFARGICFAAKYEMENALEAFGQLTPEQARTPRALVGVAGCWMEKLEYEKAEKAFSSARSASPHSLLGMSRYSTLLWHLRQSSTLSFLAQDLMLIAPLHPTAWLASGNVFSHLEDHASALKCFRRAAQLDPACVEAYTLSGHECVVLEEWERALGFFREAVRREKRCYQAWFGLGNVYLQTGKLRLAEYHFRQAASINPTNATLICCVGSVLEKLGGRRKDALELYEKACQLAPESPAVRFKRVRMLIHLKQYELAESDLLHLKDRAPNEFNVHYLLGRLYKHMGQGREAEMLKHFGLAQDLEPRTASMVREQIEREVNDQEMEVDDEEGTDGGQ